MFTYNNPSQLKNYNPDLRLPVIVRKDLLPDVVLQPLLEYILLYRKREKSPQKFFTSFATSYLDYAEGLTCKFFLYLICYFAHEGN